MLVATDIYDVLAGQTALDVFHQDLYPSGDSETRGGMYSRAKGYGGLAQLANAYLQMAGLPPTQENYNMAFKALGAGAAIPVTQEVPEGKSVMTAYFDRLLGRTPKEEEKKETLKEIMLEDESSEPDFDTTGYPYDPTDWRDITRESQNLYTAYGPMDFFGKALGIPGGFGASSEENKEREKKAREVEELMYTKEVVDAYEKAQKEKGTTFSPTGMLEKVGEFLTGMADPARNLYNEERQAALTDAFGKAIGFDDKAYEGFTAADIAREGEIDLETSAAEAQLNKEQAAARAGVPVDVYDQLMSQRQFDGVGSAADLDRDMEYESFGDWIQALANSAITGQYGSSRRDVAQAAIDAEKARAADRGDEARDTSKNKASRSEQATKDPSGIAAREAEDKVSGGDSDVSQDTTEKDTEEVDLGGGYTDSDD
tara:strand:+ start:142 stop:1425 length:1284 start_codon:yes stop_codon:yes gene_type:complete